MTQVISGHLTFRSYANLLISFEIKRSYGILIPF